MTKAPICHASLALMRMSCNTISREVSGCAAEDGHPLIVLAAAFPMVAGN